MYQQTTCYNKFVYNIIPTIIILYFYKRDIMDMHGR